MFGSRAGDKRLDSDTDIMIEFNPAAPVWVNAGLKEYIASRFDWPVDVVSREGLKF